jgi:hypothetical protein
MDPSDDGRHWVAKLRDFGAFRDPRGVVRHSLSEPGRSTKDVSSARRMRSISFVARRAGHSTRSPGGHKEPKREPSQRRARAQRVAGASASEAGARLLSVLAEPSAANSTRAAASVALRRQLLFPSLPLPLADAADPDPVAVAVPAPGRMRRVRVHRTSPPSEWLPQKTGTDPRNCAGKPANDSVSRCRRTFLPVAPLGSCRSRPRLRRALNPWRALRFRRRSCSRR